MTAGAWLEHDGLKDNPYRGSLARVMTASKVATLPNTGDPAFTVAPMRGSVPAWVVNGGRTIEASAAWQHGSMAAWQHGSMYDNYH